jgi:hypothetical protein
MESSTGCVIIGAGIVGCSVAEHLSRLGWRDVVVLDQGPLFEAGGSTSHAPGLMFQTNPSKMLPALERAEIDRPMNGLFSFTPDGGPLLGESKEAEGFWIAEAVWITHAIGVGKVMAEWITEGVPSMDISGADVHRFEPYALSPSYILARSAQSFREVYDIIHPQQPMEEPRPLRTSPFFPRQQALGPTSSRPQAGSGRNGSRRTSRCQADVRFLTAESGPEGTGRRSSPPKPWPPANVWPSTI